MEEVWSDISDYPGYAVSNWGVIQNTKRNTLLRAGVNQQGIPSIVLYKKGVPYRRSVARIVALEFLEPEPNYKYDIVSIINLDGNRLNNRADNLAWRPRAFATSYHNQFKRHHLDYTVHRPILVVQTGEIFQSSIDIAVQYGLLHSQVLSTLRQNVLYQNDDQKVWPALISFRFV